MLWHVAELHAVVREHRMDLIRDRLDQGLQEARGGFDAGRLVQLGEGDLRCSIDGHEEVQLAFFSPYLGDIDVEVADGIALEWLLGRPVAGDLRQTADPVTLQATV